MARHQSSIEPVCRECDAPLVKVISGLLCPEGHGKILPLEEFEDTNVLPVSHAKCQRIKQVPTHTAARMIAQAQKFLDEWQQDATEK